MTNFEKTKLTDKGIALLAREGIDITFTRIETGCGEYQEGEEVGSLTALKNKVQEFGINGVEKKADTLIELKFVITNQNLATGYLFTEIGVYAIDPEEGEILYAVCYSTIKNADEIKKYNGIFASTLVVSLLIEVASGSVVTISKGDIYALAEDLDDHRNADNPHNITPEKINAAEKEHVHDVATQEENGFMSAKDKKKLDELEVKQGGGVWVSVTAPEDTSLTWVDTSTGGIYKYYDAASKTWKPTVAVWG